MLKICVLHLLLLQLQMNLMPYEYIPPVDIKTEPYIPETGTQKMLSPEVKTFLNVLFNFHRFVA